MKKYILIGMFAFIPSLYAATTHIILKPGTSTFLKANQDTEVSCEAEDLSLPPCEIKQNSTIRSEYTVIAGDFKQQWKNGHALTLEEAAEIINTLRIARICK